MSARTRGHAAARHGLPPLDANAPASRPRFDGLKADNARRLGELDQKLRRIVADLLLESQALKLVSPSRRRETVHMLRAAFGEGASDAASAPTFQLLVHRRDAPTSIEPEIPAQVLRTGE